MAGADGGGGIGERLMSAQTGSYAGNPNDLYSVDELKDFYV
jgi:hypothetical protein